MATALSDVAACRACLETDGLCLVESGLEDVFMELTGLTFSTPARLRHLCSNCRAQLAKWAAFKDRCRRASRLLEKLTKDGPLTTAKITCIDRRRHKLTLNLTKSLVYTFNSDGDVPTLQETSVKYENKNEHDASFDSPHFKPLDTDTDESDGDIQTIKEKYKKNKIEGSSATVSSKTTKNESGYTEVLHFKCKRKKIGDDFYPEFDYGKFEKEFKVKIKLLSKEEQRRELEDRKTTNNYLKCPFRCDTCGKGFNYEKPLRNHMSYHDPGVGPFECDICYFRFRSNRKRLKHVDLHRLKFTCVVCGFESRERGSARRHCAQHAGAKYPCMHCQAVFQRTTSYFNHMRAQHPSKNIPCTQCGETFLSARGVAMHQARAHRPNVKPEDFKCPTCDVSFPSLEALERHTDRTGEHSAFPCLECGEGCNSEELLKAHVEGHHKQHRCEECDISFPNSAAFDTHHRRKHLNMRGSRARQTPRVSLGSARVVCEQCGRLLQNETALKYHQRIHQAVKPFACPQCPKTFAAKHARDFHLRTHTGERPFQCDQCAQTFSLQSNLKRHRRVVHQGIRSSVPCELCGKTFTTMSSVRLHVNTVHRRMPAPKRKRTKKQQSLGDE